MKTIDLKGRTALVTGGSRGLGRAAAFALAEAGADVAVQFVRDEASAAGTADACRGLGVRALALQADMASTGEVDAMFGRVVEEFEKLDILVASAGIWKEAAIDAMTDRQLAEMLDINVKGVFACCRAAVRAMKPRGSGRIILVSSTAGQRGESFHAHYAASKGAVQSLAKSLAAELAPDNILVNCIAPGWFDTDMARPALGKQEVRREVLRSIPLRRVGRPEEFAGAVLFLASDLSSFVTGEILNVNGGAVLCG